MSGVYAIFDYFKEAFHINRENKVLYRPQIQLIILRALAMLIIGVYLYSWVTKPENLSAISNGDFWALLTNMIISIGLIALFVIFLLVLSLIVEAGLLNMYKTSVLGVKASMDIFWEGVSKYFFKLIAGYLLIMVGMVALLLAFIIVSIFTLGIGAILILMFSTIIFLLIQIFLSMWKVSLVMDDMGVIDAFKNSFNFAKTHLWPLLVLQLIHWSFSGGAKGSSGFNLPGSWSNGGGGSNSITNDGQKLLQNKDEIINSVSKAMKIGFAIAVPTITVVTAVAALIGMIFEVFFSLSLFIAYKYQFREFIDSQKEVSL